MAEKKNALVVDIGGYTTAGAKTQNEDAFAAKVPQSGQVLSYKGVVACLADGVSACDGAQLASQTSVIQFIEDYYSAPDSWSVRDAGGRVLTSLNSWLFNQGMVAQESQKGLVTTFTSVIIKSTTAHVIHAGDSRLTLLRDGRFEQITRDHSMDVPGGQSVLTRALGMDSHLEVDYQQIPLQVGDLLLLTSDGVHQWLSFAEARDALSAASDNLERDSKRLVNAALAAGSDDNLSCLMVKVLSLPTPDLAETHRQLTQLAIPPVMEPGNRIDQFSVKEVIFSGTRSHLYRVVDESVGQVYALKAPSENFVDDLQHLEGFVREEWVGRRLDSHKIMKILPRPEESRFLYHLCEWIDGQTLRQWMDDHPQAHLDQIRQIVDEIVQALRVFQRRGMVHRDLKPENIMVLPDGGIKLIDFGTVRVEGLDEVSYPWIEEVPVGSVHYIAPEYMQGESGTSVSDLFSLAVIVYEMLTGALPYNTSEADRRNPGRVRERRYRPAREINDRVPLWLDLALEKACAWQPARRYQAFGEFVADIKTPNARLLASHQSAPLLQRNPLLFWQSCSALLLLIVLIEAWFLATH